MRKAFIGLSTPIGFDYRNQASRTCSDTGSSPNPILDSPFGLMLLFDELVFLTRSLCPENMRSLPFVTFLDEQKLLPDITEEQIESVCKTAWKNEFSGSYQKISFEDMLENAGVTLDSNKGIDNHSHGLKIGSILQKQANASADNFAIDLLICSKINDPNIELIANSRIQPSFEASQQVSYGQLRLTELLVIENIPNYLTQKGPYHPVIDQVRENQYLRDFRKWVSETKQVTSAAEIKELKQNVEHALQEAQDKVFLKYLDQNRHYQSVGKALIGDLFGLVFPFTGTVSALAEAGIDVTATKQHWQGFLIGSRNLIRKSLR